jgi:hypothetical protein
MIGYIVKNYNISTLLIYKLFDHLICNNTYSSMFKDNNFVTPIHYLSHKYGLKKCYLDGYSLVVLFDTSKTNIDHNTTKSNYYTFLNRLTDSEYLYKIRVSNKDKILAMWLNIPEYYHKDIDLLKTSAYSKVSRSFKQAMLVKYTMYNGKKSIPPFKDDKVLEYIIKKSIPYRIVTKNAALRRMITAYYNVHEKDVGVDIEVFNEWNDDKELWLNNKIKFDD